MRVKFWEVLFVLLTWACRITYELNVQLALLCADVRKVVESTKGNHEPQ
jgi:hypothetical protein